MTSPSRVLIAGGGPAAVEAALTLHELAPELQVTLLSSDPDLVYRPLSVVEPFANAGVRRYPLAELARFDVALHQGRLAEVQHGARRVVTESGRTIGYDALLIAIGVRYVAPFEHVMAFTGPDQIEAMRGLVQDVEGQYSRRIAFYAPHRAGWTLPLYELALQTAERAWEMSVPGLEITLVTHEDQPLEAFGAAAVDLASSLLEEARVRFITGTEPPEADRVVALGVPQPPEIAGLPAGFLSADEHGAVVGVPGVWAAGDVTDRALRQGGLATQQAAAAATAIAAAGGALVDPQPYAPVLRAMLIAGRRAHFLRRRLDGNDLGQASARALWWPPSKIAGERLAPFLDALDAEPGFERKIAGKRAQRRAVISREGRGPLT